MAEDKSEFDLNGLWKSDDGVIVRVNQQGQSISTTFIVVSACPLGGIRDFYIKGELSGNSLKGNMMRCATPGSEKLITDCGLRDPWETTFTATVTNDSISGQWFEEHWGFQTDANGKLINCHRDDAYSSWEPFSLTRIRTAPSSDKKDCSGLQRSYEQAKSFLDTQDDRIFQVAKDYNCNKDKLKDLDNQSKPVKDEAISEVKRIAASEGASLALSAVLDLIGGQLIEGLTTFPIDAPTDYFAKFIYTGSVKMSEGIEVPPVTFGFDAAKKFYEFYKFWESQKEGLNTDAYRELANKWQNTINVEALQKMLDLIDQMNSVIARMHVLMNKLDILRIERSSLEKKAAEAEEAWEECLRDEKHNDEEIPQPGLPEIPDDATYTP